MTTCCFSGGEFISRKRAVPAQVPPLCSPVIVSVFFPHSLHHLSTIQDGSPTPHGHGSPCLQWAGSTWELSKGGVLAPQIQCLCKGMGTESSARGHVCRWLSSLWDVACLDTAEMVGDPCKAHSSSNMPCWGLYPWCMGQAMLLLQFLLGTGNSGDRERSFMDLNSVIFKWICQFLLFSADRVPRKMAGRTSAQTASRALSHYPLLSSGRTAACSLPRGAEAVSKELPTIPVPRGLRSVQLGGCLSAGSFARCFLHFSELWRNL